MSVREVADVLSDLDRRARRSRHAAQRAVIFRLATCCGLRAAEVAGLHLRDLRTDAADPRVAIPRSVGKGRKARDVPLSWDVDNCAALRAWKRERLAAGARATDPVVCILDDKLLPANRLQLFATRSRPGRALNPKEIARKFKIAVKCLGPERQADLHTHAGRHTFATHMVHARGLAAVRDAMGHSSLAVTSIYLHVRPEDHNRPGRVWSIEPDSAATGAAAAASP